jgi:1-acyl-sn-glycerol-3-phosphate acyltransferase
LNFICNQENLFLIRTLYNIFLFLQEKQYSMRILGKLILRLLGWKVIGEMPDGIRKCIMIEAPHTSNIDFILGRLAFYQLGINARFLIKKELFKFPLGGILKAMGGIPVDRGKKNNMVDYVADLFSKTDELVVIITPEGTRKYNAHWKKGFYHIALKANVPILLGFIDYKKKEGGIGPKIYPTGDYEKEFALIEDFYKDKTACHPENYNLSPMYKDKHKKI